MPKALKKAGMLMAACLFCMLVSGWTEDLKSIQKTMSGVQSISADVVQKKHLKILSKPLSSQGHFLYQAPDSLRWEYSSPIKSIVLVHAGIVKRYIWKENGFIEDTSVKLEAVRIVMGQISKWFQGRFEDNTDFTGVIKPGDPFRIVLTPRNDTIKGFISEVVITFSQTPGVVSAIEIIEQQGTSTVLEFHGVVLNHPIPERLFEYVQ
jgi:outer membrane lipoprotein-sorting protein